MRMNDVPVITATTRVLTPAGAAGGADKADASSEPPSRSGEVERASARCPRLEGTPYVVVRLLGRGGMGEVYEVEHAALGRHFAVKLLHREHVRRPDLAVRMREEARTLAALRHRSLVEVFDLGSTLDGRAYFTMELLEGRDLRRELARVGVFSVPAALGVVAQALDGLEVVHRAGVVHRDIKLENLFLCDDGGLKVLDFGIAKLVHRGSSFTGHGVLGTARSMAPEQHASRDVDARADIYAAGLVLYELVAGRGPFDEVRGRDHAMRYAHCDRRPPDPSSFAPQDLPRGVEEAILKAIAKRPEQRFQSAAEMAAVLRDLRAEASKPEGASSRAQVSKANNKTLRGIGAVMQPLMDAASALWSQRFEAIGPSWRAGALGPARIFPFRP